MKRKKNAFLDEVDEQPGALRNLTAFYRERGGALLETWAKEAHDAGRVVFSGMGTSELAPEAVLGALARNGIDATTRDAGEWLHYPRAAAALCVLISQSGESYETRKLAEQLKGGCRLVAITNDETSGLARSARLVLPMVAGHELSVSTKTYVNTLAVLHLMACSLEGQSALENGMASLDEAAETMPKVDRPAIDEAVSLLADASAIHFIARGPAMAAARQAALTFMEGTRISSVAFTGGAFRHGPLELADPSHRCVFFIPDGPTRGLLASVARETAGKGSRVIIITDADIVSAGAGVQVLRVPRHGEELFPITSATTQELLLNGIAVARGLETGRFRHGGKITAIE